jgi:hypothetical protein|tara:strand:- start:692 stop:1075 length:384 start_codon:yes stop_codon:yes gene_type:complete
MGFAESQFPANPAKGSYRAQSPTLYKKIEYNEKEIWEELGRICAEDKENKYTDGQQMYYNHFHFVNPIFFRDLELEHIINEYYYCTRLNVSPGRDIDSTGAFRLECFSIIHTEMTAIENKKQSDACK